MTDVPAGSQSGNAGASWVHPQLCFLLENFRLLKRRCQILLRSGICCLDSGKKFSGLVSDTMRCSIWAEADVGGLVSFLVQPCVQTSISGGTHQQQKSPVCTGPKS